MVAVPCHLDSAPTLLILSRAPEAATGCLASLCVSLDGNPRQTTFWLLGVAETRRPARRRGLQATIHF
ncbi:hypothetical protein GGTG_02824 [Gaeumannomyces tritici R3-111a-1]|uniref:Uncharacterized protein n=1 Tax=Gaeumannomyces tritici (strain R3-111a-1) TaxID=644352 RepID=J3NNG8_GAET3|nr:hypothetical protein GGTG_02824 [Gaeumannomyces tritici R3-111a-1]EJT77719.1 hypothetical protein GGTG_02824 [Gaeumannomyces tritici R3-111a-1]